MSNVPRFLAEKTEPVPCVCVCGSLEKALPVLPLGGLIKKG